LFIFLNLTLYSFHPENLVPLDKIKKFPKSWTEETESYKIVSYSKHVIHVERNVEERNRTYLCTNPVLSAVQFEVLTSVTVKSKPTVLWDNTECKERECVCVFVCVRACVRAYVCNFADFLQICISPICRIKK
jgi:hypothetical protein